MTLTNMINNDELPNEYIEQISYVDLENSFTVTPDEDGFYKFNLNSTVVIDPESTEYRQFQLKQDMAWPLISYKIYGDTREAWLLMKLNNVKFKDVFRPVQAGKYIKYFDTTQIQQIANIMSNL